MATKGKGKTALKQKQQQAVRLGMKVKLIQFMQRQQCSKCSKLFGKSQMIVEHNKLAYCNFSCVEAA